MRTSRKSPCPFPTRPRAAPFEGEGPAGLRLGTRWALLDGFRRYAQPVCRTRRRRPRWLWRWRPLKRGLVSRRFGAGRGSSSNRPCAASASVNPSQGNFVFARSGWRLVATPCGAGCADSNLGIRSTTDAVRISCPLSVSATKRQRGDPHHPQPGSGHSTSMVCSLMSLPRTVAIVLTAGAWCACHGSGY